LKTLRTAVLSLIPFVSFAIFATAQTPPNLETGYKPYGSHDVTSIDSINTMNGDLQVHIGLPFNYSQRGDRLSLPVYLQANSKGWHANSYSYPCTGSCVGLGWGNPPGGIQLITAPVMAINRVRQTDSAYDGGGVSYSHFGYTLTTRDGATHTLSGNAATRDSTGEPWSFDASDTSGFHVELTGSSGGFPTSAVVTDRNGNVYQFGLFGGRCKTNTSAGAEGAMPPTHGGFNNYGADTITTCNERAGAISVTDANGNVVNFGSSDTLGRSTSVAVADTSGCVGAASSATLYSFPPSNGSSGQLKMCINPPNLATAFNAPNVVEYPNWPGATNYDNPWPTRSWVTTAILPDQSKYTFSYDSYGEITSIGLPTGGSITYGWTTIVLSPCGDSTSMSRAVTSRSLTDGFGHTLTWSYSYSAPSSTSLKTVVTDPNQNDTVHIFTPLDNGACMMYETSTQFYNGSNTSGALLKQVDTHYLSALVPDETGYPAGMFGNVVPDSIKTTVYPSNKVSQVTKSYDPPQSSTGVIFGNVITEKAYDWGPGTSGPLLRETDTVYQWQANSAYLTARLLDEPASVAVVSPNAGSNTKSACPINATGGTASCMAETDYSYDEAGYLTTPTPAINTQHVAPNGVRGNQTTVSHWLSTGNTWVTSHTNWYDTGEVYQAIDALGHTTTHTYDPAYIGAYATQTCSPATNAVAHCVSGTYDFNSGLLTSLSNENATTPASGNTPGDTAHTSIYSYDAMLRLTSALAPPDPSNGGLNATTSFNFSAPNAFPSNVQRTTSITASLTDSATSFFDGIGRGYQSQHILPNGTSTVDTIPDFAGRPATVSNPYFSKADPTYGTTTNLYDGLGRVYQTNKQDGSVSKVAYSVPTTITVNGDCTQTTDEAGKQRGACSDALGRLVEVDEPSGTPVQVSNHATLQTDGNFVVDNAAASALWSTGTSGSNASGIFMQDDASLVLYIFKWQAGVYVAPTGGTIPYDGCRVGSSLFAGQILASGACLESPSGRYMLLMQSDGNLFIYDRSAGHVTWAANTYGHSGAYATLQSDGNFVVYATNGAALWNSATYGTFSERLDMGDDGRIIIYKSAWNSGTSNGSFNWTAIAHPGCDVGTGTGWTGVLGSGQCFVSPNGRYELLMQGDGDLVIYDRSVTPNQVLWSAGTATSTADPGFAMRTFYSYDALGNLLQVDQKGSAPNDSTQWRTRTFTYDSLSRLLTANNPESGTITYSYDADGNLLQKTSPAPNQTGTATQTVSYCYDELHRVTGKGYGAQSCPLSTPVVTYGYDSGTNAIGKLTSLTDQAGTASYTYDILGRLTAETRTLTGANNAAISKNLSYSYNLNGSLKSLTYPSGNVVTYTPDSAGRTLSAIDSGNGINYVTSATYGPDSALTGFVSGNSGTFAGITNAFSYNKRLQPLAMSAAAPSQTVFSISYDFHFGNGNNGNVFGITNYKDQNRNQTFTYDALNRLISAQNAGTDCGATLIRGKSEYWGNSYGYDAWGNLLQKSVTKCGAENLSVTADAHNWIHASGTDYQYDAAGNMTYDATASLSYNFDQENRLTGAAGYAYSYDGDGNRVRKSNNSTGTLYWYMTPGIVGESDLSGNLQSEYVFFDGERVARKDFPSGAVSYYFSDHLKTASVITDSAGVIKAESDYYPWGGELQFVNNDSNHYKFTGKERDGETQLDYFGARYYSNGLGRWVSADWSPTPIPVPYADFNNPQSLNLYGFVGGNPASKADPDGHVDDNRSFSQKVRDAVSSFGDALQHARMGGSAAIPPPGSCACPTQPKQDSKTQNSNNSLRNDTKAADQMKANAAQGKAFEKTVVDATKKADAAAVEQVTIKTESGVKTRMDVVSKDASGNVVLQEAKSSATAPLTPNQTVAHSEIGQTGGTVVGQGKPGYPGGTKIPPTDVRVVRPPQD
jgi:RHS repeat-associated protein